MRKLEKAGRKRHSYKLGEDKKDTVLTLEIAEEGAEAQVGSANEFTEGAHLRQVLCLLPSDGTTTKKAGAADSSDDSEDDQYTKTQGNLEPSKAVQAYIRVSKMVTELNAQPKSTNIVRTLRVS